MLDDGSLPDKRQKTTLVLSFVLAGVLGIGTAHAPLYENTEKLLLSEGSTLMASTPTNYPKISTLGVKFASVNDFYWEVVKYPDWNIDEAMAVLLAESSGNNKTINEKDYHKTGNCWGSYGGWQLACFRGTPEELFDIENSTRLAYELWQREGFRPWGAYNNKLYLKVLNS